MGNRRLAVRTNPLLARIEKVRVQRDFNRALQKNARGPKLLGLKARAAWLGAKEATFSRLFRMRP